MRRNEYLPEGAGPLFPEGQPVSVLRQAMEEQTVLEGLAIRCDARRDLTVRFGGYEGIIPRSDAIHPAISGAERDIAVLSRVGKPVCFTVTAIETDGGGKPRVTLSRRAAQEQAIAWLLDHPPRPGDPPGELRRVCGSGLRGRLADPPGKYRGLPRCPRRGPLPGGAGYPGGCDRR